MKPIVLIAAFVITTIVSLTAGLVGLRIVIGQQRNDQLAALSVLSQRLSVEITTVVASASSVALVLSGLLQGSFAPPQSTALVSLTLPDAVLNGVWSAINATAPTGVVGIATGSLTSWTQNAGTTIDTYPEQLLRNCARTEQCAVLRSSLWLDVVGSVQDFAGNSTWGAFGLRANVTRLLADVGASAISEGCDIQVLAQSFDEAASVTAVLTTALSGDRAPDLVTSFVVPSFAVNSTRPPWTIRFWRRGGVVQFAGSAAVSSAVLASFGAGVLAILIAVLVDVCCFPAQNEERPFVDQAPRIDVGLTPPFFVMMTEICGVEALWLKHPRVASDVLHGAMRACTAHAGCIDAQLVGDGVMVVATTALELLAIASLHQQWADHYLLPEGVVDAANRKLVLRVALHAASDATATRRVLPDGTCDRQFHGPDVEHVSRLRRVVPCGFVSTTPTFRDAALAEGENSSKFAYLGASTVMEIADNDDACDSFEAFVVAIGDDPLTKIADLETRLSASERDFWTRNELVADSITVGRLPSASMSRRVQASGRADSTAADFADVMRAGSSTRARGSSASRFPTIEAMLNHPSFSRYEPAPFWLPSRACGLADEKRLQQLLQDYLTTAAEARSFASLLTLATYYYQVIGFVLRPLAPAEQKNISRRLQMTFGVPERGFAQRLAVQCAVIGFRTLPSAISPEHRGNSGPLLAM